MHPYVVTLLIGALCCSLLFALRLRKCALPYKAAFSALILSAALGFVLAKAVYVLCLGSRLFPRYGAGAFLRMNLAEFSFVGGALGVILGVAIACRIHRTALLPALDAFAPAMALMMFFARGGEYFLGMQGVGAYLENEKLFFFPLAVANEWEEYFLAVFMLSAVFALCTAVAALCAGKKTRAVPGLLFELVLYHLALSQILGENLRVQCMKWGFVRTEQLFCALICLFLLSRACYACFRKPAAASNGKKPAFLSCFWPVAALVACAGVLILMEFALDGKIPLAAPWCYAIMVLTLCLMSGLVIFTARRRMR